MLLPHKLLNMLVMVRPLRRAGRRLSGWQRLWLTLPHAEELGRGRDVLDDWKHSQNAIHKVAAPPD